MQIVGLVLIWLVEGSNAKLSRIFIGWQSTQIQGPRSSLLSAHAGASTIRSDIERMEAHGRNPRRLSARISGAWMLAM